MKTAIIAKKGVGVTTFIKRNILAGLNSYVVFDFLNEYQAYQNRVTFDDQSLKEIQEKLIKLISEAPCTKLLILDGALGYLPQKPDPSNKNKPSYSWLTELLKEKQFVINTYGIKQYQEIKNISVDKIFLFETNDSPETRGVFVECFPQTELITYPMQIL